MVARFESNTRVVIAPRRYKAAFFAETQLVVKLRWIKPNCLYALAVIMLQWLDQERLLVITTPRSLIESQVSM